MILITSVAQGQLEALEAHYEKLGRDLAIIRITEAVAMAGARIEEGAGPFFSAPRPYPELATYGWNWLKEARYWTAFTPVPSATRSPAYFLRPRTSPDASDINWLRWRNSAQEASASALNSCRSRSRSEDNRPLVVKDVVVGTRPL
jgi:hypothetical protein